MIKIFEKVIREEIPKKLAGELQAADFPLNYIKFSTVTSGSGLNDKVIFLVFKSGADTPFLCIKTVRNYQAKSAILRNFENLKKLNALTAGSQYERFFARAVHLHDDGENIFSIETACLGNRIGKDEIKLKAVIEDYVTFQAYIAKNSDSLRTVQQLANETVRKSSLNANDQSRALEYFSKLPPLDIRLPKIIQHGDLTPDNILLAKDGLCVVDYDDVGNTDIPGFDIFNLFKRFNLDQFLKTFDTYFSAYFKKVGAEGKFEGVSVDTGSSLDYRRLLFLYHFIEHTQKKGHNSEPVSVERIISDFEHLYSKFS